MRPFLTITTAVLATCAATALAAASPALPASGSRPALDVTPRVVVQGQAVRVRVYGVAGAVVVLHVDGKPVPLHRYRAGFQAYVGTSPSTRTGRVRISAVLRSGARTTTLGATVSVRAGRFGVRRLRVPPALLDPMLVAQERRRMAAATAHPLPAPLWSGSFRRPVDGPVTSGYGVRSVYNGIPRGHHLGTDFRAAAGTFVRAGHDGLVTLAEALPLSGRTVVLDHGAGIFTTYQHLSVIAVRPGRRVRRGEIVGRVGSTGLSTGPHLHWGMRLHGTRVDPLPWTAASPLTAR